MKYLYVLTFCFALLLVSCSEENITRTESEGMASFSSKSLPECASGYAGKIVLTTDTKELLLCTEEGWKPLAVREISRKDSLVTQKDSSFEEKGTVKRVSADDIESCAVSHDSQDVHIVTLDCGSFKVIADDAESREKMIVPGKDILDVRDSQTYRTIVMGTQTWMRDDMNYEVEESSCDWDSCGAFPRDYSWAAAMTVCPEGTHLPSVEEFKTLYAYVDSINGNTSVGADLRSRNYRDYRYRGLDSFGFNATGSSSYGYAEYWTSVEVDEEKANYAFFQGYASFGDKEKTSRIPVRCILDK